MNSLAFFAKKVGATTTRYMAVGRSNGSVYVYDVSTSRTPVLKVDLNVSATGSVRAVTFDNTGQYLLAGDSQGTIYGFDWAGGNQIGKANVLAVNHPVTSISVSANGRYFLVASPDGAPAGVFLLPGSGLVPSPPKK